MEDQQQEVPMQELTMRLSIRARGLELSDELRDHVTRRLSFALARVSPLLRRVDVTLEDVNGPKGGIDKVCRVRARGPGLREIVVEERHSDVMAAVDVAASRAGRAVLRASSVRRLTWRRLAAV
jgi:ribosome-associated translation inhibitor RaiA